MQRNSKGEKMNEKITLYPSNWLYNAGVVGFLRVVEFGDNEINKFFHEDGKVEFSKNIIRESYQLIFDYHQQRLQEKFSIVGKNRRYPNYIQKSQEEFFQTYYIEALTHLEENRRRICNWCKGYFIPSDIIEELETKFPTGRSGLIKFMTQREKFQGIHFSGLGAAFTEMPNAFWNLEFSAPICHLCSYLIIFHHLSFIKIEKNHEIFINTPHFGLTWDLNKFVEEILKRGEYEARRLLGSSLIEWAIKRRVLLGAWTMMNIEVIVKRSVQTVPGKYEDVIDYFDLPYHITRILLDHEVASLIKRINEEKIFDLIVSGKFSELEKASYFVLRGILKLKNNQDINENDPLTTYIRRYKDVKHLMRVSELLPELYAKILKVLKQAKGGS